MNLKSAFRAIDSGNRHSQLIDMSGDDSFYAIKLIAKRFLKDPNSQIVSIYRWFIAFKGSKNIPYSYLINSTNLITNLMSVLPNCLEIFKPENLVFYIAILSFLTTEYCDEIEDLNSPEFINFLISLFDSNNEKISKYVLIIISQLLVRNTENIKEICQEIGYFTRIQSFLTSNDFYIRNITIFSSFFGDESIVANAISSFADLYSKSDFFCRTIMVKGLIKLCSLDGFPQMFLENNFCDLILYTDEFVDDNSLLNYLIESTKFFTTLVDISDNEAAYTYLFEHSILQIIIQQMTSLGESIPNSFLLPCLSLIKSFCSCDFSLFKSIIYTPSVLDIILPYTNILDNSIRIETTLILCFFLLQKDSALTNSFANEENISYIISTLEATTDEETKIFIIKALIAMCETNKSHCELIQDNNNTDVIDTITSSTENEELNSICLMLLDIIEQE